MSSAVNSPEPAMSILQLLALALIFVAAPGVVLTRDPTRQVVALTFYGLVLAIVFVVYAAPDVALSQIVVGAVVLPLMVLLALAKIRRQAHAQAQSHADAPADDREDD